MIRIGLVGAGFMGNMHARCYEELRSKLDFRVTAVADDNPEKAALLAGIFGAAVYTSATSLIENSGVDIVDICLPTYLHREAAIRAMRKGCHVIIEKPVCLNEEEARELLDVQRQTNAHVMVGQCIRFWPEYMELKRLKDQNTYGRLISGVFQRISPRPTWAWEGWLDDPLKSGSAALDLHIHDVDFVRYLLGVPQSIKSELVNRKGPNEHIFSLYQYEDSLISIEGGWDYPAGFPFEMAYRVKFERATVTFSSKNHPAIRIYQDDGVMIEPVMAGESPIGEGDGGGNITSLGGYYNELKYFLSAVQNGSRVDNSTLQDGCDSLSLTLRAISTAQLEEGDALS